MVSPALAARDSTEPTSSADLAPLACVRYRPLAGRAALAHADLVVGGDSTASDPPGAARGAFGGHPCRMVAAGDFR